MENRTKTIKLIAHNLKTLNPDDYSDAKELIMALSKMCDGLSNISEPIHQLKTLIPQHIQELNFSTEDEFRRELNYSKAEIDKILENTEDEDFDKILAFELKLQKCKLNKTKLFSKERKEVSSVIHLVEGLIKSTDELFDYIINNATPMLSKHINLMQIKKGNTSALEEITDVPILLKKDEKCYIKLDNLELYEDVSVRDTLGGYSGFSFRIAKGVSYRIGGFKAKGESHMEKRLIDKGCFYITNKRYIFDGSAKNIDVELGEIVSVEAYSDGIKISRANKRDEFFAGDGNWEYVGAVISGIVKNTE